MALSSVLPARSLPFPDSQLHPWKWFVKIGPSLFFAFLFTFFWILSLPPPEVAAGRLPFTEESACRKFFLTGLEMYPMNRLSFSVFSSFVLSSL